MKKHIAILGPVGISIPPKKQGGIEWIVSHLTKGLIKRGHKVLLFAPKNAKTPAKLVPVSSVPMAEYKVPAQAEVSRKLRVELTMLSNMQAEVLKRKKQIGLILNHTVNGGIFAHLEKTLNIPVFHILHLPLYQELADVYKKFNARLISISNNQRKIFPDLRYVKTIYNGIDLEKFPFAKKPKDNFIFAGKLRQSKNPLGAIIAVKKAKAKLMLAGKVSDPEYFQSKIKPHLNKNIVHLGEVPFLTLLKFYSRAKALLCPIKWEEPFGLVMIEAMACGTPVIAFNRGAVPELIEHGKTGFIVKNTSEMVQAMKKIDQIKRKDCRTHVEENFSVEKMVNEYEKLYVKNT